MAVPSDEEQLRRLRLIEAMSIRARVALGTRCLETAVAAMSVDSPQMKKVIEHLWRYSSASNLGVWQGQFGLILAQCPDQYISMGTEQCLGLWGTAELLKFAPTYFRLPYGLLFMLYEVGEIAGGNLYGGYESHHTAAPLLHVLALMDLLGLPLPDLEPFTRSSASEFHGWGHEVPASFFGGPEHVREYIEET